MEIIYTGFAVALLYLAVDHVAVKLENSIGNDPGNLRSEQLYRFFYRNTDPISPYKNKQSLIERGVGVLGLGKRAKK